MHIKLVICQEDLLALMGSYTGKSEAIGNAMEINISENSWQTAHNLSNILLPNFFNVFQCHISIKSSIRNFVGYYKEFLSTISKIIGNALAIILLIVLENSI